MIGVGNAYRGDDAAGLRCRGAPARARPRRLEVLVLRAGADAAARRLGRRRRQRSSSMPPRPARRPGPCTASTPPARHSRPTSSARRRMRFGVGEAIELARALGKLPATRHRLRDRGRGLHRGHRAQHAAHRCRARRGARASRGGEMHEQALMSDLVAANRRDRRRRGRDRGDEGVRAPGRAVAFHARPLPGAFP